MVRLSRLWPIAWVVNGAKVYEHGFPDEDTARRVLAAKIGDLAAGWGGIKRPELSGPDLIDDGKATKNPARTLPKKTRALIRPTYQKAVWRSGVNR